MLFERFVRRGAWAGVLGLVSLPGLVAMDANGPGSSGMSLGEAALLGLVEGLTEWLPISSTGHLAVTQALLGNEGSAATSYAIAIQAGAILAVLGLYRHRFIAMLRGVAGGDDAGRRTFIAVAVASAPAVVAGLAFEDFIKAQLFGPWPIVAAWFAGGVLILAVGRRRGHRQSHGGLSVSEITPRVALLIGSAQVLALWPGTSRSLVTILAAGAVGVSLSAAVEFSFLLGFVILGGATLYEGLSYGGEVIVAFGILSPLVGLGVAFLAAAAAIKWMVGYLETHDLAIFGWYRIGVAAVVGVLLLTGVL